MLLLRSKEILPGLRLATDMLLLRSKENSTIESDEDIGVNLLAPSGQNVGTQMHVIVILLAPLGATYR